MHNIAPIELWSCNMTCTLVAAYFDYSIRASNFLGRPVTFQIYWQPRPVDTKPWQGLTSVTDGVE